MYKQIEHKGIGFRKYLIQTISIQHTNTHKMYMKGMNAQSKLYSIRDYLCTMHAGSLTSFAN